MIHIHNYANLFGRANWLATTVLVGLLGACSSTLKPTLDLKASASSLEEGQTITLEATVEPGVQLKQVEFYQNDQKIGQDSTAPYGLSIPVAVDQPGEVGFSASATTLEDATLSSKITKVMVLPDQQAPSISLSSSSSQLNSASTITLLANASDNLGVVKVEFYRSGTKLGQDTTPADGFSLNVTLSAEDVGTSKYSAKAFDARGNSSTSSEVNVVLDMDVVPPSIGLVSSKASLKEPGFFSLVATASDNQGVAKVEFFNGSIKLGERTEAPYAWQVGYIGNHLAIERYSAKAYDAAGNTALSNPVDVEVDVDISTPTASLTSSLTTLTAPSQVTLFATASDNRGVLKVEFFDGVNKLGEDTSPADGFAWSLGLAQADNGVHSYTAKAIDAAGNAGNSKAVLVTVSIP
jgi:hypothetical protein